MFTIGRLKISRALLTTSACVMLVATVSSAALTDEQVAKKLASIHLKEVLLNRMVTNICMIDAKIEVERNRESVYKARDEFEKSITLIKKDVAALDQDNSAVKSLTRQLEKGQERWFRMRVFMDREMKEHEPSESVLGEIALMETGIEKVIDRSYKLLKREASRGGKLTLGEAIQETRQFERVMLAEKMVKEACLVAMKEGGQMERALLHEATMHFEKELELDETSPLAPVAVKALVKDWRAIIPRVRALASGEDADETLLVELEELKRNWFEASGVSLLSPTS
ncbi:MAG: hypothetical protein AAFP67_06115 [Pseudomonadota bacterium]